jgi:hypothetical protein
MTEEIQNIITEIDRDIRYFKNLGFDILAEKFTRDLNVIKSLTENKS